MIYNALKFGAATSNRVSIAGSASMTDLVKQTVVVWVNVTTLTTARFFYGSQIGVAPASDAVFRFGLNGTAGNVTFSVLQTSGTTHWNLVTTDTPLSRVNEWAFVAVTYDDSLGSSANGICYSGTITSPPTVRTATVGAPSGTIASEAAGGTVTWGNKSAVATQTFPGDIALGQIYNRVLTLAEITQLWANPITLSGCVNDMLMAANGNSYVRDRSGFGNHGIISGAVPVFNPIPRLPQDQVNVTHWKRPLFPSSTRVSRLTLLGVG